MTLITQDLKVNGLRSLMVIIRKTCIASTMQQSMSSGAEELDGTGERSCKLFLNSDFADDLLSPFSLHMDHGLLVIGQSIIACISSFFMSYSARIAA